MDGKPDSAVFEDDPFVVTDERAGWWSTVRGRPVGKPSAFAFLALAALVNLHPPFVVSGLALVALYAAIRLHLRARRTGRRRAAIAAWIVFTVLLLAPFEVTLHNAPGPPRFVPIVYGLPADGEVVAAAKRGDVVLGGCVLPIGWPILHCRGYWVW